MRLKAGGNVFINCLIQKKYNGGKPFPEAKDKLTQFQYSGISFDLFINISARLKKGSVIEAEPYIVMYENYKKDKILYENPNEKFIRRLKAFGIRINYSLNSK